MLPMRISNATRVLGESQDEYHALTIRDEMVNGINYMTSLWEPTPQEIEHLMKGGHVKLTILGTGHPPVIITTQGPPEI